MRRLLVFCLLLMCAATPASAARSKHVKCHRNAHHRRVCTAVKKKKTAKKPTTPPTASAQPVAPAAPTASPAPATPAPVSPDPAPAAPATPSTPAPTPLNPVSPGPALPSRTGVELREFSVLPTRNPLAAGSISLDATNYGEDDHDLTIADASGKVLGTTGVITPQNAKSLSVSLPAGQYKVYCSLFKGAHDRAGMHATLTVQ